MQRTLYITAWLALGALPAPASPWPLQSIAEAAERIEREALAIHRDIRLLGVDESAVGTGIRLLGCGIAQMQKEIEAADAALGEMSTQQIHAWQSIRLEAEILSVFHDRKSELAYRGMQRNRAQIRQLAEGIAKRARQMRLAVRRLA